MRTGRRGALKTAGTLLLTLVFLASVVGLPFLSPAPGSVWHTADLLMEVTELLLLEILRSAPLMIPDALEAPARQPVSRIDPLVVLGVGLDNINWGYDFARTPTDQVRGLADTILLGVLNRASGRVAVISIPRDTLVFVHGVGEDRINAAFARGGIRQLTETVETLLGIPVHRYVIVDFDGFRAFVDFIGGVEIVLETPLRSGSGAVIFPAGRQRLDGRGALRFARLRYGTVRQDIDRVERQRMLLLAMARALQDDGLIQAVKFVVRRADLYRTDLTPLELVSLYPFLRGLDMDQVDTHTLPGTLIRREYWRLDRAAWESLKRELLSPAD